MGGALALHTGFHVNRGVAGVFACSSFLNHNSIVYESLKHNHVEHTLPELLMFHGDRDKLAQHSWGKTTFDSLQQIGVNGQFFTLPNAAHELTVKELVEIKKWIAQKLPPMETDLCNKL